MPTEISRKAPAILSILQAQQGGITPNEMSEQLVPVIDLGALYMLDLWENLSFTDSIGNNDNATHTNAVMTVPQDEIWRVHHHALFSALIVASDSIMGVPVVVLDGVFEMALIPSPTIPDLVPPNSNRLCTGARDYWARGGTAIGWQCILANLGVAVNVACQIAFTRFRIS